jgi:exosome complex component RRP40
MANMSRSGKTESKQKRDKMQIDILPYHSNKYFPQENDTVIGIILMKNAEFFTVDIFADSYACLNILEFQNATKKEQPRYPEGTLVYCRVLSNDRFGRTQLSCINPLDKKAWNSGDAFFQSLKGGFVVDIPISFCRQQLLSAKNDYLLEKLGAIFAFDICTGFNGKVWIKAERAVDTILICNSLKKVVEKLTELQAQKSTLLQYSNVYQIPEIAQLVD